jgi:hypothetical protein
MFKPSIKHEVLDRMLNNPLQIGDHVEVIDLECAAIYTEGKLHWKEKQQVVVLDTNQYNPEIVYIGIEGENIPGPAGLHSFRCFRTKGLRKLYDV